MTTRKLPASYAPRPGDERVTDEDWARLFRQSYTATERDVRVQAYLEDAFRRAAAGEPPMPRIRSKCLTDPRSKKGHERAKHAGYLQGQGYGFGGTLSEATLCVCACHRNDLHPHVEHPDHPVFGRICPGKYVDAEARAALEA